MNNRGFTLIEILIAMAIFTMIGLASTALLSTVIDSDELSSEKFQRLQQLQRFMLTFERDILQAIPRAARIEGDDNSVVFSGGESDDSDADGLAFVRGGWHNPRLTLPRSTLQGVAYRLKDNSLQRLSSVYVDNVTGFEPKARDVLHDVTDFRVEFYTQSGTDADVAWSDTYLGESLPLGVKVTITLKDLGEIHRVFALLESSA